MLKGGKSPCAFKRPHTWTWCRPPRTGRDCTLPRARTRLRRGLQPGAAMWSVAIVVLSELGQHSAQVTLVEYEQAIETFGSDGPHDPLSDVLLCFFGTAFLLQARRSRRRLLAECSAVGGEHDGYRNDCVENSVDDRFQVDGVIWRIGDEAPPDVVACVRKHDR